MSCDDRRYLTFYGRGFEEDFVFEGRDLSGLATVVLALKGRSPPYHLCAVSLGSGIHLDFIADGAPAAGRLNTVAVRAPSGGNGLWPVDTYDAQLSLTDVDGVDEVHELVIQVREAI